MTRVKAKQNTPEEYLDEVLNLIYKISGNRGWNVKLSSKDTRTYRYATIDVFKYFSKDCTDEKITASIEVDVNYPKGIKLQIHNTSFYNYGLSSLLSSIKDELNEIKWFKENTNQEKSTTNGTFEIVENILNRFDRAVRQLKRRYDNRPTITINDEYDVQDFLHSILKCYFDDLRPEDYTPNSAGSSSRVDFVLKKEQIIIEVKFATPKLTDKKVGEQLIIDIKRYETHPDCKTLFCFVYDPDGNIKNPIALENDLSGIHGKNNLKVKLIIAPK